MILPGAGGGHRNPGRESVGQPAEPSAVGQPSASLHSAAFLLVSTRAWRDVVRDRATGSHDASGPNAFVDLRCINADSGTIASPLQVLQQLRDGRAIDRRGLVRRVASDSAAGTMAGIRDKKKGTLFPQRLPEGGMAHRCFSVSTAVSSAWKAPVRQLRAGRSGRPWPGAHSVSRSRLAGIEADHRGQQQRIGQAMGR